MVHPDILKDSYLSKPYLLLIDTPEIAIFQAIVTMFCPRSIKQPPEAFVQSLSQGIVGVSTYHSTGSGEAFGRVPVLLNEKRYCNGWWSEKFGEVVLQHQVFA